MSGERSIGAILSDIVRELTALFRSEIRLAKTEFTGTLRRMAIGLALIVAGAILLLAMLIFLLEAALGGLMLLGLTFALSAVVVAGATLILGVILAWIGLNRLKASGFVPKKTIHQFERDAAAVRERARAS